ncbi:MAG: hypothetical protein IPJ76_10630 [Flavobacteriales bacterium]|nr:MAG: hypothetical protein IPJ76_10630 [Flavobacteriales bacterium]
MAGAYNDLTASSLWEKGFILQLDVTGGIDWSTYFGDDRTRLEGLDFDATGRLYLVGDWEYSYPSQSLAGASSWAAGGEHDLLLARFSAAGALQWCTSYGGSDSEFGGDIVCTPQGFWVSGQTLSTTVPLIAGSGYNQSVNAGGRDLLLLAFNSSAACQKATFVGGSDHDTPGVNSLAATSNGHVYFVGNTLSSDFPLQQSTGFYDDTNGDRAAFVLQFSGVTRAMMWGTYVYGSGNNAFETAVVDNQERLIAVGFSKDPNFPLWQAPNTFFQGSIIDPVGFVSYWGYDGAIMCFNPAHVVQYASYFGGEQGIYGDVVHTASVHANRLLIAGMTDKDGINVAGYFPLFDPGFPAYYDETYDYNGGSNYWDGWVGAICTDFFSALSVDESTFGMPTAQWLDGTITLCGLSPGRTHCRLVDSRGRLVRESSVVVRPDGRADWNCGSVAAGTYVLRTDQNSSAVKVAVQN